jgi:RNA polymerase sigma factor (sigma-70 family)
MTSGPSESSSQQPSPPLVTREQALEFARQLGPRSLALAQDPSNAAELDLLIASGFSEQDAVLGIVHRGLRDDRELLEEYVRHLQPELLRLGEAAISGGMRRRLDKSDLCQSVLGDLLPTIKNLTFRTRSQFLAYLANKMRWKAVDRGRQRLAAEQRELRVAKGVRGDPRAAPAEPVETLIDVEEQRRLEHVLEELPQRERQVLKLYLGGCAPQQIAEQLSVTRDAVYKALQRGLARLKLLA